MPQNLEAMSKAFIDGLVRWAAEALPHLLAAVLMLVAGLWFSGWIARQIGRMVDTEHRIDPTMRTVLMSMVLDCVVLATVVHSSNAVGPTIPNLLVLSTAGSNAGPPE